MATEYFGKRVDTCFGQLEGALERAVVEHGLPVVLGTLSVMLGTLIKASVSAGKIDAEHGHEIVQKVERLAFPDDRTPPGKVARVA